MTRPIAHVRANLIAYLALFIALGGTSYAAVKLPKNSVGAKQIKKNAVTSSKVKNGSLRAKDFPTGELPAGPAGAKGDKGDKGDTGPAGAPGTDGTNGTNGATGAAGTSFATRATFSGDQQFGQLLTNVPLQNADWTQTPNELDLFYGEVTLVLPSKDDCLDHGANVSVRIDSEIRVLKLSLDANTDFFSGGTRTFELEEEPGRRSMRGGANGGPHSARLIVSDGCGGLHHLRVLDAKIDVVRVG